VQRTRTTKGKYWKEEIGSDVSLSLQRNGSERRFTDWKAGLGEEGLGPPETMRCDRLERKRDQYGVLTCVVTRSHIIPEAPRENCRSHKRNLPQSANENLPDRLMREQAIEGTFYSVRGG